MQFAAKAFKDDATGLCFLCRAGLIGRRLRRRRRWLFKLFNDFLPYRGPPGRDGAALVRRGLGALPKRGRREAGRADPRRTPDIHEKQTLRLTEPKCIMRQPKMVLNANLVGDCELVRAARSRDSDTVWLPDGASSMPADQKNEVQRTNGTVGSTWRHEPGDIGMDPSSVVVASLWEEMRRLSGVFGLELGSEGGRGTNLPSSPRWSKVKE